MSNRKLYAVLIAATILASLSASWTAEAQLTPQVRATKLAINRWGYNSTKGGPDIVVNIGDTVRITTINNDTNTNHNWGVDILSPAPFQARLATTRGKGNTTTFEFTASMPGVFKYYCNVGRHRALGLEGNLMVNSIAPPAPDVSGRVKTLEDQVSSLPSLTNQVRDLDGQVKSISSSITNQVKGLDDQIKSVSSSVKSLASASDQVALKVALDSVSSQNTLLMGLLGVATLLAIVALGVAVMAARKKSS